MWPYHLLPCYGWREDRIQGPFIWNTLKSIAIINTLYNALQLANLLETINLALASPSLTESILDCSKAYLFLVPSQTNTHREKIVGCVMAQRISTAMAIASPEETASAREGVGESPSDSTASDSTSNL